MLLLCFSYFHIAEPWSHLGYLQIEALEVDFKTAVDETFDLKAERGTLEGKWRQSEEHLEVARRDVGAKQFNGFPFFVGLTR